MRHDIADPGEASARRQRVGALPTWNDRRSEQLDIFLFIDDHGVIQSGGGVSNERDVVGHSIYDFVDPLHLRLAQAAVDRAIAQGEPEPLELAATGPNGQLCCYSTWIVPLRSKGDSTAAIVATDVSRARAIEQALRDERNLLESLILHAPDHITVVDREHRIEFINHTDKIRLGLDIGDVLGAQVEEFTSQSVRERLRQAIDRAFESGAAASLDVDFLGPNGNQWFSVRIGPVVHDGRIDRVSLVSTNITEEVEAQADLARERESLRMSEERFRTLVEQAPDAITIFDLDHGHFVEANAPACRLYGYSRDELLHLGPEDVSPPTQPDGRSSAESVRELLESALAGECPVFEWNHQRSDGTVVPCEVRLVHLAHSHRRWVRGSITDISERKLVEEENRRLAGELAQAQKMQALGQLTGGIAHDFNNLLTVIQGSLELAELNAESPDNVRDNVGSALDAAGRAAALTQHLLAFARRQPLRPQAVNVNGLVRNTETILRRTLGESISFEVDLAQDAWPSEVDPSQLQNALLNLALNARDAMPEGGRLTICTENVTAGDPSASDAPLLDRDAVAISVADTGQGMDDEVLRQAFDPFFTTRSDGNGLGLSMVYGFVKQSGGEVRIQSAVGRGTTVTMYMPRANGHEIPITPREPKEDCPSGAGELILIVEDEESVRKLVEQMLVRLGYRTLTAPDAGTALELLNQHDDVSLLLTDVVLEGAHGPELARQALEIRPQLLVLFMSGYHQETLARAAVRNGPLLAKPFSRTQLAQAVQHVIHSHPGAQRK